MKDNYTIVMQRHIYKKKIYKKKKKKKDSRQSTRMIFVTALNAILIRYSFRLFFISHRALIDGEGL